MIFELIESYSNCDFEEVPDMTNLTGVTMGDRQTIIANLNPDTPIILVRDYKNEFDKNAIAVNTFNGVQLGWIPRHLASILAPEIDAGIKWKGKIDKIVGNEETLRGVSIKLFYLC